MMTSAKAGTSWCWDRKPIANCSPDNRPSVRQYWSRACLIPSSEFCRKRSRTRTTADLITTTFLLRTQQCRGRLARCKAMGATRRDIVRQFFAESAILTVVSGLLGLSFGMGDVYRHGRSAFTRFRAASDCFSDFDRAFDSDTFLDL